MGEWNIKIDNLVLLWYNTNIKKREVRMTIINFINKYLLVYLNKYSIQTCKNSIDIIIYLSILSAFIFMIVLFIKCGKNEKIESKKDIFIIFIHNRSL